MAIEKGLIIKSLLGVSAVGGGVTVVAVGHKEGWLSNLGTDASSTEGAVGAGGAGTGDTGQNNANAPGAAGGGSGISGAGGSQSEQATRTSTTTQTANNVSQKKKFEELKIPDNCEILETDTTTTFKDCDVSKEDLVKIAFKDKDDSADLTIETGQDDFTGMKLEVKKLGEEEKKHYGSSPEFIFTFKDFSKTVTLKKSDGTTEVVKLVKGTNPVFKKTNDNKLERIFADEASICQKVGLTCSGNTATITTDSEIPFLEGEQIKKYKLKDSSTSDITDKITVTKDSEDYNQGFKFSITNKVELKENDEGDSAQTKDLEAKDYQILFKDGKNGGWYFAEKTTD